MERVISATNSQKLQQRQPIDPDPAGSIAIKRDVHEFEVECDASDFVAALTELITDAEATFGLIRVKRPADRMGRPFEVGERFQGSFSIERAATKRLASSAVRSIFEMPAVTRLVTWLENQMLSNYAEIETIELEPDLAAGETYRLRYRYLEGTPIAGSSTFTVEPLGPGRCRVRQIFEYQEVNGMALGTFQRFGLKFHDQVVHSQIEQAAQRAGVAFSGTIPETYARL